MSTGRHKSHHTHEVNDAYADGWDARAAWTAGQPKPANPYTVVGARKQSDARYCAQQREITQWETGWTDCDLDLARKDLPDVAESDFRTKAPLSAEDFVEVESSIFDDSEGEN